MKFSRIRIILFFQYPLLIDSVSDEFEWHIFQQIIAKHPYGNKLCPSPLQLVLFSYESEFMHTLIKDNKK
jgi:hypothetical protein